jgi:hypothetical protein
VSGWWLPMVMVVAVMPGADAVRAAVELPPALPPGLLEPELLQAATVIAATATAATAGT